MKSKLLLSKILSYCSSPKLESPVTSVALGQSQVSQSLKVTSWCLESGSKVKMDYQPIPGLVERFQALCQVLRSVLVKLANAQTAQC